ncbi:MAG: DNA mismatch repair endonuclease MutL [Puniceicoccaceae bacterium]|nr:MAG: DNA mismatch repair endonuclease MutL [Puniceicoccaceae bacterium]
MPPIRILPDTVANQIAAGEVVERPASVVKELIENSLDAGARRIEVEFRRGGRSLIRVEDDGAGMSRDDALLCLERHATSKIRRAEDLGRIASFGFRGEALPSIASVSRFTLQTRTAETEHGTEIVVSAGRILEVKDCGMPVGTRVSVAHLFHPVPARRKFLRTDATESAHIIQTVRLHALAAPGVAFSLLGDGRTLFRSGAEATLEDRVRTIFGPTMENGLLPVRAREGDLALTGLVGKPGITRSTRHEIATFVNRRPVDSRTMTYAILESYQTLLPRGRFPVAFLFLELPPALVDVNVHPSKREVRFREEPLVRGFTIRSVLTALGAEMPRPVSAAPPPASAPAASGDRRPAPMPPAPPTPPASQSSAPQQILKQPPATRHRGPLPPPTGAVPSTDRRPPDPAGAGRASTPPEDPLGSGGWTLVGWLDDHLALLSTTGGLIVLDVRAARQRILFERIEAAYLEGGPVSQDLLIPVPLELDPIAAALLVDHLELFARTGFRIEPFGRNFFRIESVPDWLEPGDAADLIRDLVALARAGRLAAGRPGPAAEEIARRAAIRAGREEAPRDAPGLHRLMVALLHCRHPQTSPTGSLVYFQLSRAEIERRLHRGQSRGDKELD